MPTAAPLANTRLAAVCVASLAILAAITWMEPGGGVQVHRSPMTRGISTHQISDRDTAMAEVPPGDVAGHVLLEASDLPVLIPGASPWRESGTFAGPGGITDIPCQIGTVAALGALIENYRTYQEHQPRGLNYPFYGAELVAVFRNSVDAVRATSQFDYRIRTCATAGPEPFDVVQALGPGAWRLLDKGPDVGVYTVAEYSVARYGDDLCILQLSGEDARGRVSDSDFLTAAAHAGAVLRHADPRARRP